MHASDSAAMRAAIRAEMRSRRAGVTEEDQAAASMAVLARLAGLEVVRRARVVAGYRAVRGEVDIEATLMFLAEHGAEITTPRVRGEHLEFVTTDEGTPTVPGPFGIPEAAEGELVAVRAHDLFLMPLVAFDALGHRLGQGGGFYDRALAVFRTDQRAERPTRIGVAHAFQQVDQLPAEPWDVPLDAVVTEEGLIEVTPGTAEAAS
jgi:5-formyltetrahydrofolate cyclo-ligase